MKVVFSVAAQSDSGWETLLSSYQYSMVDIDKRKMLVALASTDSIRRIVRWARRAGMRAARCGHGFARQEPPHAFLQCIFKCFFSENGLPLHILCRLMQDALEGSNIQTQELPLVLRTVSRSFAGHLYAWNFVKENWDTIIKKWVNWMRSFGTIEICDWQQAFSSSHSYIVSLFCDFRFTPRFPIGSFALQDIIMSTTSQFSTERHLVEVRKCSHSKSFLYKYFKSLWSCVSSCTVWVCI